MDAVNGVRASYGTPLKAPESLAEAKVDTGSTASTRTQATADTTDTARLSSLAQMLSDAATRAATRDASTDRKGLASIAERATQQIHSPAYENTKAARDAEVPPSDDAQRLNQARQATDYLNGKGANPFKGLSLEQLTLIVYDESDTFTVNERRAALVASHEEQEAWSKAVSKQVMDEYNRDGHMSPKTLKGILDYYKGLPAILESQLVDSYETDLNRIIKTAEGAESRSKDQLQSLLDLLLAQQQDNTSKASATDD